MLFIIQTPLLQFSCATFSECFVLDTSHCDIILFLQFIEVIKNIVNSLQFVFILYSFNMNSCFIHININYHKLTLSMPHCSVCHKATSKHEGIKILFKENKNLYGFQTLSLIYYHQCQQAILLNVFLFYFIVMNLRHDVDKCLVLSLD